MKKIESRISDDAYQKIKESGDTFYNFTQKAIYEKIENDKQKNTFKDLQKAFLEENQKILLEQNQQMLLNVIKEQLQNINIQRNIFDEMHDMDKKYRADSREAISKIATAIKSISDKVGQ
jgi:ASC-1-like (ASCH) protein